MRELWLIYFIYWGLYSNLTDANAALGVNPFCGILGNLSKVSKTDPGIEYLRMWMDPQQNSALNSLVDRIEKLEGKLEDVRGLGRNIIQTDLDSTYAQFVNMMRVYVDNASTLLLKQGVANDIVNIGDEARPYYVIKIRPVKNESSLNLFALDAHINAHSQVIFDPLLIKLQAKKNVEASFVSGLRETAEIAEKPQIILSLDSIIDHKVTRFEEHELEHAIKEELVVKGHPSPLSTLFSTPGNRSSKLGLGYQDGFSVEEVDAFWVEILPVIKKFFSSSRSLKDTNEYALSMVRELNSQIAFTQEAAHNTELALSGLKSNHGKLISKYVLRGDPPYTVEIPYFQIITLNRPPITTEIPLSKQFVGANHNLAKTEAEKTLQKLQTLLSKRNIDLNQIKSNFLEMNNLGFDQAKTIFEKMISLIDSVML